MNFDSFDVVSFVVHSYTTQSLGKKIEYPEPIDQPSAGTQRKSVKSEVHGEPWGPINLHLAARLGRMQELREVANSAATDGGQKGFNSKGF